MANTRKRKNQEHANRGNNHDQSGNDQSGNDQSDNQQSDDEGKTGNLLARQMRRFIEANPSHKFVQEIVTEHAKTELRKLASKKAQDVSERMAGYPPEWITNKRTFEAQFNQLLKTYLQLRGKGKEMASESGNVNNAEAGDSTSSPPSNTDARATTDNSTSVDSTRATPESNTSAASTRATPDNTTSQSNASTARTTPESEAPSVGRGSKQANTNEQTSAQTSQSTAQPSQTSTQAPTQAPAQTLAQTSQTQTQPQAQAQAQTQVPTQTQTRSGLGSAINQILGIQGAQQENQPQVPQTQAPPQQSQPAPQAQETQQQQTQAAPHQETESQVPQIQAPPQIQTPAIQALWPLFKARFGGEIFSGDTWRGLVAGCENKGCDEADLMFYAEFFLRQNPDVTDVELWSSCILFSTGLLGSLTRFDTDINTDAELKNVRDTYRAQNPRLKRPPMWVSNPEEYRNEFLRSKLLTNSEDQVLIRFARDPHMPSKEGEVFGLVIYSIWIFLVVRLPLFRGSHPRAGERLILVRRANHRTEAEAFDKTARGKLMTIRPVGKPESLRGRKINNLTILGFASEAQEEGDGWPLQYTFGSDPKSDGFHNGWVRSTFCGRFSDGLEWINQQRSMCMLKPICKWWDGGDEVMDGVEEYME